MTDATWWKRGAIYQIYPRSFNDSDGDGIGDLAGVTERLDHLNDGTKESLGVEALWLSPFFPSPMADFGYDVMDYTGVDPVFGTLADFDRLVEEAHRRDIRVVIDWVPNHTSDQHPWFVESRSSRNSAKRDWYIWRDPAPGGGPPNRWKSSFPRVGRAWTWDETTEQWYLNSFLPQQADLNWDNPEVRDAMHDVLRFWLDRGVDGFRIDVAHRLGKDPELGENEPHRPHDEDWPTVHDRMREIRAVLDEYEDRMAVGEVYILDQERLAAYVNTGDELHLAHNFVFLNLPWSAARFREVIDEFEEVSTEAAWPAWCLNNHDHSRVATRYDEGGNGGARARLTALMLLSLRGTPFLFEGEELGLTDVPIPPEREVDIDGRDPQRAPIPWSPPSTAGPGAGFTSGEPWLPVHPDAEEVNAEAQKSDPRSTFALYRRLCWLRRESEALRSGGQRSLDAGPDLLAYVRSSGDERLLVALNFAPEARKLAAEAAQLGGAAEIVLSTRVDRAEGPLALDELELAGGEGVLVRLS